MYTLFLKIATRYLIKNKLYSFINIFGLALGIASFILIMGYVNYERSYDKFEGSENVYRVYMDYLEGEEWAPGDANAYIVSGPTLKQEFAEVRSYARLRQLGELVLLRGGENPFDHIKGSLADQEYLSMFDRKLVKGNLETALTAPYTMVLDAKLAKKIFGDEDPIGQTLKVGGTDNTVFTVTGIMDNSNYNTHLPNDVLISFDTFYTWKVFENDWQFTWNQNTYFTYLSVDKMANFDELNEKVMAYVPKGLKNERHHLEPVQGIHLNSHKPYEAETNGNASSIRLLAIIALITILLSWVNYMNLSSSKSLERAKEIGVRKVAGAKRPQLVTQFLVESALVNVLAFLLALILVYLVLPSFNALVGQHLSFSGGQFQQLLPYLGFVFMGTLLAALYPALVLSRFNPYKVLKGKAQTSKGGLQIRKALTIGQFMATIALLIGTFVAQKQIHYLKNRPMGADLKQVIALKGQVLNRTSDSIFSGNFDALLDELKKSPFVASVSTTKTYPGDDLSNTNSNIGLTFPNGETDTKHIWYNYSAQPDYFSVMDLEFLAGEAFPQTASKKSQKVVINETMAHFMGIGDLSSAIGKTVNFFNEDWTIYGIVKDYNHFGLKSAEVPLIIRHYPNYNIVLKLNPKTVTMNGTAQALEEFKRTWHTIFPVSTFDYAFVDQQFQSLYEEDQKFAKAFQIFTVLAIIIASLGLFGLTAYTCIQRKKEIGIRKVNGATIGEILALLNKDFIKWIGVAFIIAVPIAWLGMNKWLEGFTYKTSISWWIFVLAGAITVFVALLTVSWQSFSAAVANPVNSLRDE